MKKAVVTNALSVVGYALCRRLLEDGIEVAAIDDVSADTGREEKRDYFGRNALFTFFNGKIDQIDLREALEGADVCFYMAVPRASASIHEALRTTLCNTRVFLDAISENPPFMVIYSSTDVYRIAASNEEGSVKKTWPTLRGIVSVVEEALWSESGLPAAVLRFPEIYGPDEPQEDEDRQAASKRKPQKEGDDLLYIDNAVEAFLSAAEKAETGIFDKTGGREGTE